MRTRAAVLHRSGLPRPYAASQPLSVVNVELDPPGPDELLVAVRAAGLCHSDLSVIDGSRPRVLPMVLGHEAAGEVLEVGSGVTDVTVGDHVVTAFVPCCGTCDPCRRGRPALCEPGAAANTAGTLLSGGRRLRDMAGDPLHHHLGVSAFAEHMVVSSRSAVVVDDALPWDVAALFGCAVLTGVGAVLNSADVQPDDQVAIFGLGGVGLSALLAAKVAGARTVIAIDTVPAKLELALQLGATHAVAAGTTAVDEVRRITHGGADTTVETVGHAGVLADAYAATRRGGATVTVGLPAPDAVLPVGAAALVAEERTLRGSYLGSCTPRRDVPRFIDLHRRGALPVEALLTHRLPLEDINTGFDRLAAGIGVRQAVVFS